MSATGTGHNIRRLLTSLLIAAILWIVLWDALPLPPEAWSIAAGRVAARIGIYQAPWSMFSPPDGSNHRLKAELTFRDGRVMVHELADLAQQSPWQRFLGHRRSEYVDNSITLGQQHPALWEALADRIVREYAAEEGPVAQVRIIVELAVIPPPGEEPWAAPAPLPFEDRRVVFRRKFR